MAIDRGIQREGKRITAKSSENFISLKKWCLKILEVDSFLKTSLNNISTTITFYSSTDANGMEQELFKKKRAFSYEKGRTIEFFYEPSKLGRTQFF